MPGRRTLIIATHRTSLLELVDRVIVLEQGQILADGPKRKMLQVLTAGGGLPVPAIAKEASHG
jgi:ABC-type bacteriocin/lantibiotic exporter with double-glycine peptidase domain